MLKLPDGYTALVTSGAAAAYSIRDWPESLPATTKTFIKQLPTHGTEVGVMHPEIPSQPVRSPAADTGVKLIEIETRDQLRQAIGPRTAMMHFTNFANPAGQIKVDEWAKLAKEYKLPCMNDAAGRHAPGLPSLDYANMGYDLVTFWKAKLWRTTVRRITHRRKDLVGYALLNNSPHEDTLGRSRSR